MTKNGRIYIGKKILSSISETGKTGELKVKGKKVRHSLTSYTEMNSTQVKDLNVRLGTMKLLEKNIGRTIFNINHSKNLFDPFPTVMKIKINK